MVVWWFVYFTAKIQISEVSLIDWQFSICMPIINGVANVLVY